MGTVSAVAKTNQPCENVAAVAASDNTKRVG